MTTNSRFVNLGFYSYVPANDIALILSFEAPASKRLRDLYKVLYKQDLDRWMLDLTRGRRTLSCVLMKGGELYLSIRSRINILNQATGYTNTPPPAADKKLEEEEEIVEQLEETEDHGQA